MSYKYTIALSFATEDQSLVEKVYHYLNAEKISVFFAPAPECQIALSGKNQREVFYDIFGLNSEYVALFVSNNYITREVPMEEASIAFAKHSSDSSAIPIYLDGTPLPSNILNPKSTNYFKSNDPAAIASHIAGKIKPSNDTNKETSVSVVEPNNVMNIKGNRAEKQIFIQTLKGNIEL